MTRLVMSLKFTKKQIFKIERLIYIRNVDETLNKERLTENSVKVNIYY